jgi:hypothetical protein
MTNRTQYAGQLTEDTTRLWCSSIWGDCPVEAIRAGDENGILVFDDFEFGPIVAAGAEAATGLYKGFASTGGSVAAGDEWGGTLVLSSDGDNEGASFGMRNFPFQISRSHGKFWFECRIKTSTITDTKHGIFVGLIDNSTLSATVPIAADGTLADENFVGFHRLEGDGDYFDTVYKADGVTQVSVGADAIQIAADTYVKLGMKFDPRTNKLTFYKNGVIAGATKTIPSAAGTDFPNDVRLGLVIAVLNATGTTPGETEIDWWRCAQVGVTG